MIRFIAYSAPFFYLQGSIKCTNMKKFSLFIFSLLLLAFLLPNLSFAQTVFKVSSKYDADIKVYVASSKYDAHLVVYEVSSKYDANEDGRWFFTDSKYDAKKKIFFVDSKYDADLIIYFANSKYDAGWRDRSKSHLLK